MASSAPPNAAPKVSSSEQLLVRFIRLCGDALSAPTQQEAAALIVNRIAEISRTDRAVLVDLQSRSPLLAASGGTPLAQDHEFAEAVLCARRLYAEQRVPTVIDKLEKEAEHPELYRLQRGMNGTQLLWLPLPLGAEASSPVSHALWLERWAGVAWHPNDLQLLQHAALFLGHALQRRRTPLGRRKRSLLLGGVGLALLLTLLFPVTASITAPMRVIADQPNYLFASMDGILRELHISPGQRVEVGDPLFSFDARVLDKLLEEARSKVAVARAELVSKQAAAHHDSEARAEVPVKELEVERAEADVAFYEEQRRRADVKAESAGVVVLDDPEALIGASLRTGELVLSIADPKRVKPRLMVPAGDVGLVRDGAKMEVRLDRDPFQALDAEVSHVGFEVKLSEDQVPSVIVDGTWQQIPATVLPGQRGVAKVYGETTTLGMQLLRKPLIALREFFGV